MWMLLLVLFMYVGLDGSCSERIISLNGIEELMEVKCIINSKSTNLTHHRFKKILSNYVSCVVKTHKADAPHPIENHEDYCKHLKEGEFRTCVRNLTRDISPCLNEAEAYLPLLMLKALNSSYERFCGIDGFSNTEYTYNIIKNDSDCLLTAAATYLRDGECLSNLTFFKNLDRGILDLDKNNLCYDLVSLPKCIAQVLERQCNGSYFRFVDLITQPFIEECSNLLGKEYWIKNKLFTNKPENN